ncbi:MAG: cyclic nucleotide-binding domain-containing protein [Rhodospirillales bacterium]|nr:cyclic nucleotide-binding domain-containing protein [Rhodospirillales bacterium]MBO6786936.1 cyclic nucleotide-binding domain-containing protein [Rhodospirillales bacterium]
MSDILERRTLRDGDTIFREGEQGSTAFVVQGGEIVITKLIDGEDTELATIGAGGIFGEMALIDEAPRMATAKVKGGATIVTITKAMYQEKLKKSDPFIRALLRILVETVRRR